MSALWPTLLHTVSLLALTVLVPGVINRVKARWAGRRGPPLLQTLFDLRRLLGKETVRSRTASWFVEAGPIVLLASTLVAAGLTPLLNGFAPLACPWDLVVWAYLLGLGRGLLVLTALDSGSAFQGMGASREVQYAALIEPALFLTLGTLAAASGQVTLAGALAGVGFDLPGLLVRGGAFAVLLLLLQTEGARVPVDDPATHLELTMIHEVMVLDLSGPDLALVQAASALKLTLCAALCAACLNPFAWDAHPLLAAIGSPLLILLVAGLVGLIESLTARLRLSALPRYLALGTLVGLLALGVWAGAA